MCTKGSIWLVFMWANYTLSRPIHILLVKYFLVFISIENASSLEYYIITYVLFAKSIFVLQKQLAIEITFIAKASFSISNTRIFSYDTITIDYKISVHKCE